MWSSLAEHLEPIWNGRLQLAGAVLCSDLSGSGWGGAVTFGDYLGARVKCVSGGCWCGNGLGLGMGRRQVLLSGRFGVGKL